jgi:hypothetical protein
LAGHTACPAKKLLSCELLAFPAAAAAASILPREEHKKPKIAEITQLRQEPALLVQYDSSLGTPKRRSCQGLLQGAQDLLEAKNYQVLLLFLKGQRSVFFTCLWEGGPGNIQAVNKASIVRHLHGFSLSFFTHRKQKAVIDIYDVELIFK